MFELYKKVDLGWSDLKELQVQIWELRKMGINPIIVFLHSYSFVDVRGSFGPARKIENNFRELVQWMKTLESVEILTMGEFYDIYNGDNFVSSNQVPILASLVNDFELGDIFRTVRNLRRSHLRIISQFLRRRLM